MLWCDTLTILPAYNRNADKFFIDLIDYNYRKIIKLLSSNFIWTIWFTVNVKKQNNINTHGPHPILSVLLTEQNTNIAFGRSESPNMPFIVSWVLADVFHTVSIAKGQFNIESSQFELLAIIS